MMFDTIINYAWKEGRAGWKYKYSNIHWDPLWGEGLYLYMFLCVT